MSDMTRTAYTVTDETGEKATVLCAERAERLSRAGLRVTAITGWE